MCQHPLALLRWRHVELATTANPEMVLMLLRELPLGEQPCLQLREKKIVVQPRQLVPTSPPKGRNVPHPWDAQVMHFRFMHVE